MGICEVEDARSKPEVSPGELKRRAIDFCVNGLGRSTAAQSPDRQLEAGALERAASSPRMKGSVRALGEGNTEGGVAEMAQKGHAVIWT